MPTLSQPCFAALGLALVLCLSARSGGAAPYRGDSRHFTQPDGEQVEVRLFGTEYYVRAESVDGYTLALDRDAGWICYAESDEEGGLRSTGIRYHGPADRETLARLSGRDVPTGLRPSSARVASTVARTRGLLAPGSPSQVSADPAARLDTVSFARFNPTLGSGKGLVVLVDFSDRVGSIPVSEYEKAFNGDTYDSLGSIRTWLEAISYGKYTASHKVLGYMRAAYPTSHYVGGVEFDYSASAELMKQVYKYIDDEIDLRADATNGTMPSLAVVYPGAEIAKVWATGLWPHAGEGGYTTSEGVRIPNAFISNGGTRTPMSITTFRHELGHSLLDWPDTYDYDDDSAGAGGFATETTLPCAPFRAWSGWLNVIDVAGVSQDYALPANGDTCLRYKNAKNASEHFIVEYMKKDGTRRADAPDDGLLIWHVDERGDNCAQDMTPAKHYQLSVEQADGLFELEKNGKKRAGDLFHADYRATFDDTTTPNSKWWNGTASGFEVCNVGPLDVTISLSVGCSGPSRPVDGGAGGAMGAGGLGGSGGRSGGGGTAGGTTAARDAGRDEANRDGAIDTRDASREVSSRGAGGRPGSGGSESRGGGGGQSGASGGSAGLAGSRATGGAVATGGRSGIGGSNGTVTGEGGTSHDAGKEAATAKSGCACVAGRSGSAGMAHVILALLITLTVRRRRAS